MRLRLALVMAALSAAAPATAAAAVSLVPIGDFSSPVHITAPPRDTSRLVVVERGGTVRLVVDGVTQVQPFLDLTTLVESVEPERGLLSLAFSPDYATTGRLYVYYTGKTTAAPNQGDIVIDEYRSSGAAATRVDIGTRRTLLTVPHPRGNHNGGQLQFGPDGYLYAATGDGGGGGDPDANGQKLSSPLGKLLRLDPRPGFPVAPADNPFGTAAPLVWAYGLRNPFRFSFDRETGDLTIGDVGQNFVEEVDYVAKAAGNGRGANFGWVVLEGRYRYDQANPDALTLADPQSYPAANVLPVIEHLHSETWCSVTGGYVVRDPNLPDLLGRYVYSDFCKGDLTSALLGPNGATGDAPTALHVDNPSSFGEDGCARVYVASLLGKVFRLSDGGACAGPAPVPPALPPMPGDVPAPPAPPPPPPTGDTTPPQLVVSRRARQRLARVVTVKVRCDERCRVRATGTVRVRLRRGTRSFVLRAVTRAGAAGQTLTLRVALPRAARTSGRAALAAGRWVMVSIALRATDASGNERRRRVGIRLRPPR